MGIPIPPAAVFLVESAGGGGYGKPALRDPAARAADVENGLVTRGARRRGAARRPAGKRGQP
jgi:N-methylhydantoinase B